MRYLKLDQQLYSIIRGNLLNATEGYNRVEVRMVNKILDKLELLGILQEGGEYLLGEWDNVLALEDAEYRFIDKINEGIKFHPKFVRQALKYLDWFANASTKPELKVLATDAPSEAAEASS